VRLGRCLARGQPLPPAVFQGTRLFGPHLGPGSRHAAVVPTRKLRSASLRIARTTSSDAQAARLQRRQRVFKHERAGASGGPQHSELVVREFPAIVVPSLNTQTRSGDVFPIEGFLDVLLEQFRRREHQPALAMFPKACRGLLDEPSFFVL